MKHLILAAAAVGVIASSAIAGSTTWTDTSGNPLWGAPGNWTGGVVPSTTVSGTFQNDLATVWSIDIQGALVPTMGIAFNPGAGSSGFTLRTSATSPTGFGIGPSGIVNNDARLQTFTVPLMLISATGSSGSGASQTWTAGTGNLLFSGIYNNQATLNLNGGTLTVGGAHNTTIGNSSGRGDIINGTTASAIIKNGTGTLALGGTNANTFSGGLTLNAGTVLAGKAGALGSGLLTLNGGTLQANYYSLSGNGALKLGGNSILDFAGPGPFILPNGTNVLSFADSHSQTWAAGATLTIADWVQGDELRFDASSTGLTAAQLSQIVFAGFPNSYAAIDANGFVVPVPEPSAVAISLVGGFSLAIGLIIRRRKD